ncbi:sulfotransferase [Oceaniferula spumae]
MTDEELLRLLAGPQRKNANLWMAYAKRLAARHHGKELQRVLLKTAKLIHKKDAAKFHLLAARLLTQAWKYTEARRHWQLVSRVDTVSDQAVEGYASMLERMNRVNEALALIPRLKNNPSTWALKARLLRRSGDAESAVDLTKTLTDIETELPPAMAAEAWHARFQAFESLGDYAKAWESLQRSKLATRQAIGESRLSKWLSVRRESFTKVNDILDRMDSGQIERWISENSDLQVEPWFLMLGMPRSGTTMLENILESHPDVVATDERDALASVVLEPAAAHCSQYSDSPEYSEAEQFLKNMEAVSSAQVADSHVVYLSELQLQMDQPIRGKVLLDKNPGLMESAMLIPKYLPRVKLIVPVRDPRAVYWSTWQVYVSQPTEISCFWTDTKDLLEIYSHTMQVWEKMQTLLPEQFFTECRYEQLITDRVSETQRLTRFMGLDPDDAQFSPELHAQKKTVHSPSYEEVVQAPHSAALAKWKNYEPWIGQVLEDLDPWLEKLNYD